MHQFHQIVYFAFATMVIEIKNDTSKLLSKFTNILYFSLTGKKLYKKPKNKLANLAYELDNISQSTNDRHGLQVMLLMLLALSICTTL